MRPSATTITTRNTANSGKRTRNRIPAKLRSKTSQKWSVTRFRMFNLMALEGEYENLQKR
jgi:hypothetical protein